jgi:hypothetical protein
MSMKKTAVMLAASLAIVGGVATSVASADDWHRGDYEYFKGPHRFGPLCEYRIAAHGAAPLALFGGPREIRRAEARSIRDWEFEASRLFGPRYGGWELAAGKEVHCDVRGLQFVCTAAANPCRR